MLEFTATFFEENLGGNGIQSKSKGEARPKGVFPTS